MSKKVRFRSLTSKEQIRREIEFLRENDIFHKYIISNYTTTIETAGRIIKFNDTMMSQKAFVAYQMIKKDLSEWTANERPEVSSDEVQYFETFLEKPLYLKTGYAVDIKSAYASILFNDGFISPKTYGFLKTLPKKARLACVGMLASRKDVFYFQGRELTGHIKEVNPLENYFWWCVKRTAEVMNLVRAETNPLFFWVDCAYFATKKEEQAAQRIFFSNKFESSRKKMFSFVCRTQKNKYGEVRNLISFYQAESSEQEYSEASRENTEFKTFTIPVQRNIQIGRAHV